METIKEKIINKINQVPSKPGCYFWKDYTGKIIYIGKAKNLKNRLKQYMSKDVDDKTRTMVSKAVDFDFVITKNEAESIVTESNLIYKYQPKYNIALREQVSLNYLIITNEKYSRAFIARFFDSKKVLYKFGPITDDTYKRKKLMEIINRYYPFRKCKRIPKYKCIYYDLNQCLGPCINQIDNNIYNDYIDDIRDLFKGKNIDLINDLLKQEKNYANNLEYEKAKEIFDVINLIKEIPSLVNLNNNEFDVFGFYQKDEIITMAIFSYENNQLISKFSQTVFLQMETLESVTNKFVYEYYHDKEYNSKKLITSLSINQEILDLLKIKNVTATNNQYSNIAQLAIENSKSTWLIESVKLNQKFNRNEKAFEDLKQTLKMDDLSLIELYDNSHLFNDSPIGVKVSFINGEKRTNLYRKFNIKEISKKSDYDYMYEIISRRLHSIFKKQEDVIPNLIIVDGGFLQLQAAKKALIENQMDAIINVIGLIKDNKHQTSKIILDDKSEIILDKRSNLFFLLANMQEEVHQFAISSFRKKRQNNFYKNELNDIKGIGQKTIKKLLAYFETIDDIKNASFSELEQVIGKKMADKISEYFKNK